ncbi:hypothetical protein ABZX30_05525 [Streptomyces sp. NPDC004542]
MRPEFAPRQPRLDVGDPKIRHPVAGLLPLPYETLTVPADPERTIVA